jgi:hypothetical protein
MNPRLAAAGAVAVAMACGAWATAAAQRVDRPSLAGRWTLNRALSEIPREVGFGMDLVSGKGAGGSGGSGSGGRSGRRSGGSRGASGEPGMPMATTFRESEADARRRDLLVDEARNPSPHLVIEQTETAVTITDEHGRARVFHPDGREESQAVTDQVPVGTISRWVGPRLEIRYLVEDRRELRYTLSLAPDAPRLVVQIQFVERGNDDVVALVYEPTKPGEEAKPAGPGQGGASQQGGTGQQGCAGQRPSGLALPPGVRGSDLGKLVQPPTEPPIAPLVATGPDAALRGLKKLGVVVEGLGAQEAACGLRQAPIEAAVSKLLTGAGLQVARNSDEDTYVYVHILGATASPGLCVSRYDVYLYTHTMATLSYQSAPVLVQVSLFSKGGMTGGPPATQAEGVLKGVRQYVDEIAGRIRDVNNK